MDTSELYEAELHLENGDLEPASRTAEASVTAAKAGQPGLGLWIFALAELRRGQGQVAEKALEDALQASQTSESKAAALLASVELRLAQRQEASSQAAELRRLSSQLGNEVSSWRLQRLALAVQVKLQIARGSGDDAMRAAMEMLAAAQKRGDRSSEGSSWLSIAEVHSYRESSEHFGSGTGSTAEETLQAADRSAEMFREAASAVSGRGSMSAAELQTNLALATTILGQAQLRLGRQRQAAASAAEAVGLFRELGRTWMLTVALKLELDARRALGQPMIGLQAANRELQQLRESRSSHKPRGACLAEAQILLLIAQTHAALSEPLGAVRNAILSAELRKDIGDSQGEADALLVAAGQQKILGDMLEATEIAERAVIAAKACGDSATEDAALRLLSQVLAARGMNDKAPQRPQALQALERLVAAVRDRDGLAAKEAEADLTAYGGLVTNKDIADHLVPVMNRDPGAVEFLRSQGWDLEQPYSQKQHVKEIRHEDFYLMHRFQGMGFGPQFRVCKFPTRIYGSEAHAVSVNQLPETEAWQMEMMYRPGFLDAGLQSGFVHVVPDLSQLQGYAAKDA